MKYLLFIIFYFSVSANDFKVVTVPEKAEVFIIGKDEKPVPIGSSPLNLTSEDILNIIGDREFYTLTVSKPGYDDYKIMMLRNTNADIKLGVKLTQSKELDITKTHDLLVSKLFRAQGLIRSGNFEGALSNLSTLEDKFDGFSVISELKGISYYMKKDMPKALSMFRLAFNKNSKNKDAYKMKVYLEKKLGLDKSDNQ